MNALYPAGPDHVPPGLTQLTPKYRTQVFLVLVSLFLSLLLYVALVVGSAWLCYWSLNAPWPQRRDRGYAAIRVVAIVCSGLLFLYLVKGLFKGGRQDRSHFVEVTEEDQPELFGFIRQVCADTKSNLPRRVYLTPE